MSQFSFFNRYAKALSVRQNLFLSYSGLTRNIQYFHYLSYWQTCGTILQSQRSFHKGLIANCHEVFPPYLMHFLFWVGNWRKPKQNSTVKAIILCILQTKNGHHAPPLLWFSEKYSRTFLTSSANIIQASQKKCLTAHVSSILYNETGNVQEIYSYFS